MVSKSQETRSPAVIFEDSKILVLSKPSGLITTAAQSVKSPTVADWLKTYLRFQGPGIGTRGGIVHRLDKDTSGLILVAKTRQSFEFLQQQFKARLVKKTYITLVHGIPKVDNFEVDLPIARHKFGKFDVASFGKAAATHFKLIKKYQFGEKFDQICSNFGKNWQRYFEKNTRFYSLLEATPVTGRTHQIRVHAKSVKLPIVSDPLYLPRKLARFDTNFCPRLFLHATQITFTHPKTAKLVTFESKLPDDLNAALLYLKEISNEGKY